MFRYAPAPRAGETLYSVLARFGRYLNAAEAGPLMREVMGRRHAIASVDMPGGLAVLVRDFEQHRRARAADMIIDRLTAFPFHTAFMPGTVRTAVRQAMLGDVTGVYAQLGLATFKVRPAARLRFCLECLDEMERERGDAWWRREHQLPGVLACPHHGIVLRVSDVEVGDRNRHSFVPASREVCRSDAESASDAADAADIARLADLSRLAAAVLEAPPPGREYAEINADHRARLAGVGLMRSARKVDHVALRRAFDQRWGGMTTLVPGLALGDDPERSWLAALVRNGRRAAHPLHHAMLMAVLDGLQVVTADLPFGSGPWPCRNPVADHHGKAVISTVGVRRDGSVTYGDFACSCGYLYTVARAADGTMGSPRYRRFGPLLAPALRAAVQRGEGLRSTARALGLDPKTLMREAAIAGVEVPWSTQASGAVTLKAEPPVHRGGVRAPRRSRPKRNWFAIDTRMVRSTRHAAIAIRAMQPPVRVTFAELERRVARRDWVGKRRSKLPQTVAAMRDAAEDTDAFRRRRLAWCVSQAVAAGDLRPCEVLRNAGLPMSWLPRVRDAIALVELRGASAA